MGIDDMGKGEGSVIDDEVLFFDWPAGMVFMLMGGA